MYTGGDAPITLRGHFLVGFRNSQNMELEIIQSVTLQSPAHNFCAKLEMGKTKGALHQNKFSFSYEKLPYKGQNFSNESYSFSNSSGLISKFSIIFFNFFQNIRFIRS